MRPHAAFIFSLALLAGLAAGTSRHVLAEVLPKKIPVTVTADKLDYDRATDVYIAVGHVKIEQEGVRLEAEKVVMNNKTGVAVAEGKVYLQDKGDVVHAEKLQINLNTREGVVTKGEMFMKKDNYHLRGDVIERRSETVYHVERGMFTTCDEDDWYIKAEEMNIDMERYATGNHVSLRMAGLPVFYTPYFLFPVRRQTGFLIPVPGYSSSDGFFMENSFFWAISDYKDMTLYSDYRARVGHGTGVEYRYMNSGESLGQVYAKVWDMYHTSTTRWDFRFQHQEEFAEDLSARVDLNLVSDFLYYYNLEKKLEIKSKPYIDSNAFYVERWNTASLYLLGQYSTDLTRTNENTVQKLPELRYTIYEETVAGPVHLNFDGTATNFYKQVGPGARRVDFNPQLTAAFGSGGLSLTPRAGAKATFYDRGATSAEPAERKYVYAGADLNARISRVYGSDGETGYGRIRHSIEPTIAYTYIPHVEQGDIPLYDSVDTAAAALNTTTLSLINRLTAHYKASKDAANFTTLDVMVFRLSQSYDLNVKEEVPGGARRRSPILGELSVVTPPSFTLSANASYDTYARVVTSRTLGFGHKIGVVNLSLSEQYIRDPATRFFIGGTSFKLGKWDMSGKWELDVRNNKTVQEEYGLHYAAQCWGIGMRYTVTPGETRFIAMLDLKGIGGRAWGQQ